MRRLYDIMFEFSIIPGTNWNGEFCPDIFQKWFDEVETWSSQNDRYEVAMHTIGNGLAYAKFDENGLLPSVIMDTLNKSQNKELRIGYEIGVSNSRGVYLVDPKGKSELALEATYRRRAEAVEAQGYSRFADSLNRIADEYMEEAQEHIRRFNSSGKRLNDEILGESDD